MCHLAGMRRSDLEPPPGPLPRENRHDDPAPLAAAAFAAAPAALSAEDDANLWLGQFATINATDTIYVRLEAQERFTNDAERLGQLLARSLVGYRISKTVNIGAGYAFVLTDPVGPVELNEHRFYQELNLRLLTSEGGVTLDFGPRQVRTGENL